MSAIDAFADDLLYRMLVLSPDLAAEMGVERIGARALRQESIPDFSDAGSRARDAMMADSAFELSGLGSAFSGEDAITHRILGYLLEEGLFSNFRGHAGHRFLDNPYPVNHLGGFHPILLMMLTRDHVVRTSDDADAYLVRMAALPGACADVTDTLKSRLGLGIMAPRFTLEKSLADMKGFVSVSPAENVLVTSFHDRLAVAKFATSKRDELFAEAERFLETEIYPAYLDLITTVEDVLARSSEEHGLWSLPEGDAYYAWLLRARTTADCSPESVHETGLEEIAHVQGAIRDRFALLGIRGEDIEALYAQISDAPQFRYAGDENGRAELWADADRLMHRFEDGATRLFRMRPRASLELAKISSELEDSLYTHYTPPAVDGSRPGRFSLNLKAALANPRWELATLCAHEGVPGHHMQLALAQELPIASAFRRTVVFDAYIEGWAKYAETIPEANGLLDDPFAQLGRLRAELYSSVNLAMDTGIHAKRWTREEARVFFRRNTGVSEEFAGVVADRSFVTPAQLCSYKIGMMAFCQARERFRAARGAAFDVRDFHDCVLGHGAVPLKVLDELVETAVAQSRSASFSGRSA